MLVPKREVDTTKQKFKKFKKFPLELYQKDYRIYQNELILSHKVRNTNKKIIDVISTKLPQESEASRSSKAVKFKVKGAEEQNELSLLKKFDFNYHQSINMPINEKLAFHFNANIQSKGDFGINYASPAVSYQTKDTYYRLGLTWGPQFNYYMMASRKFSANWSAGVLVSIMERTHLSKNKLITNLRYKNNMFYFSLGFQNMVGIKAYPIHNQDTKLYVNPYYGRDYLEGCSLGLSKKITDATRLKLELTRTHWIFQIRSALLMSVNDWLKLFLSYEIQNSSAFVSFGLKIKNFYLGIPLFNLDLTQKEHTVWLTPLVFGMACLSLFWDRILKKLPFGQKKEKLEPVTLQDKLEKRQKDIKLISRRVREIFNEESRKNGLIIVESYYGSKSLIQELIQQSTQDKIRNIISPKFLYKVLDITDSMRFYVDSSKLQIPKGSKADLYGLYQLELPDGEAPVVYLKYTYQGEEEEKFFKDHEAITLP